MSLLIGLVSLFLALGPSNGPAAAAIGGGFENHPHHLVPSAPRVFDTNSDISDIIHDLLGTLTDAMAIIGDRSGPLTGSDRTNVAFDLADTEDLIDQILDPGQYPNLTPADAGSIDSSISPDSLKAYAADCVILATEALAEVNSGNDFDDGYVGTRLKTIKNLLTRNSPHNYRTKAGI